MKTILCLLCIILFLSCEKKGAWGNNDLERRKILNHYSLFSRKYQAAKFLVDHMKDHYFYYNSYIDEYRNALMLLDRISVAGMDSIWLSLSKNKPKPDLYKHIDYVTADFILSDIDLAFEIWHKVPWRDDITFDTFKHHILPYSISNEPLIANRKILFDKYYPLVAHASNSKQAFDIIYLYILKNFKLADIAFPYFMDPLMADRIMCGVCDTRTLLIVAISRALCIPAVFDCVHLWANYSFRGHSWAALSRRLYQSR